MSLKIKSSSQKEPSPAEAVFLPDDNDFPYGWRWTTETLPDGRSAYRRVPLTPADFLDPQEGDQLIQGSTHVRQSIALYNMLDNRYLDDPTTAVFFDMKMRWGLAGLKEPAPDIAVVPNIKDKHAARRSFDVAAEGTQPCLVVEVISPTYPGDDAEKVEIYERAGVTEYIIIDPHAEDETAAGEMWGYRLAGETYQPIAADEQNRLLSETTGVWFHLDESRRWVRLTDAATGERLLTAEQERTARLAAEARAEAEAARAETEVQARREAEARAAELEARLRALEAGSGATDKE